MTAMPDLTDQITTISHRQTLYLRALAGRGPKDTSQALELSLYLVSRTVQAGELSATDRHMLVTQVGYSSIPEGEKLSRFMLAVMEAQVLGGQVDRLPVVAACTALVHP